MIRATRITPLNYDPDFRVANRSSLVRVLNDNQLANARAINSRLYPYRSISGFS